MEELNGDEVSSVKRDDNKNFLLSSKDPHLSHLLGDGPCTPNSMGSAEMSSHVLVEDGCQFNDGESREPEYRLFEEQSYVSDMSPGNQATSSGEAMEKSELTTFLDDGHTSAESHPSKGQNYMEQNAQRMSYQKILSTTRPPVNDKEEIRMTRDIKQQANFNEFGHKGSVDMNSHIHQQNMQLSQPANQAKKDNDLFSQPRELEIKIAGTNDISNNRVSPKHLSDVMIDNNSNYNMQLLAHSAQQHLLQQQQDLLLSTQENTTESGRTSSMNVSGIDQLSGSDSMHHSRATLQELATRIQIRAESMQGAPQTDVLTRSEQSEARMQKQDLSHSEQSLKMVFGAGKPDFTDHGWPGTEMPLTSSQGSGTNNSQGRSHIYLPAMRIKSDSLNVDDAAMLKNLLGNNKSTTQESHPRKADGPPANNRLSGIMAFVHPAMQHENWSGAISPLSQQSPLLSAKRGMLPLHGNSKKILSLPGSLQSPGTTQYQTTSNQPSTLAQRAETHFFSSDDEIVNNNNNQHEILAESENFVQDLIDEVAGKPSHESNLPVLAGIQGSYAQSDQGVDDLLVATQLNREEITQPEQMVVQPSGIYRDINSNQQIKSEPQSLLITDPVGSKMFSNTVTSSITSSSTNAQLHATFLQHGLPSTAAQWQFPFSVRSPTHGNSVPSATTLRAGSVPIGQDGGDQTARSIVSPRRRTPFSVRARRASGGSARKNPDGTLSCSLCGHSFRNIPALNGHMRVHSSSSDKKSKDERQRKTIGTSNGGLKTTQPSLSSKTIPTHRVDLASMYHKVSYDNVTFPTYTNPPALYNPVATSMDTYEMVTVPQNEDTRDPPLVHRIAQQNASSSFYPYAVNPHSMHPQDALFAAANLLARSESDLTSFVRNTTPVQNEFHKAGVGPMPDLQNIQLLAPHPGPKVELQGTCQKTSHASAMILVPSYLQQGEHVQTSNGLPFVSHGLPAASAPIYKPAFAGSPQQDLGGIQGHPDNVYLQQANNRSTPLEDFADIAVAHNQGQIFCANPSLNAIQPITGGNGTATFQQQHDHLQDVSSDVGLMASVSKDLLWRPDAQPVMRKNGHNDSLPLKEEDFVHSSLHIQKPEENLSHHSQSSDPFLFPVPAQCSRDDTSVTTSGYYAGYGYPANLGSFSDDLLMQEAINVANPGKILPNSMMGGNPSGPSFRSCRQRHHSEGSVLKKILRRGMLSSDDVSKPTNFGASEQLSNKWLPRQGILHVAPENPVVGAKRKNEAVYKTSQHKKPKLRSGPREDSKRPFEKKDLKQDTGETEVWTVPTQAPPNRLRHRRHSADSRVPYRIGHVFSRPSHVSSFYVGAPKTSHGQRTLSAMKTREKRRPPPLIIPPSVNTYANGGTLYTSQLHHRRRPSGDSGSSCGNDKIPPYTPPPMLSPLRFGSGLYYNTPVTPGHKPLLYRQASAECGIATIPEEELDEELVRSADPKINIGPEYQADITDISCKALVAEDVHRAILVWKPSPDVSIDNSPQGKHVEEYLKLACSAAVPFGGCNKEYALHVLFKDNGDVLRSVRKLLGAKTDVSSGNWMSEYTYSGASKWTLKERQSFERGTMQHHKDFYLISKMVITKTTAECVDYYYHTIKRRKRTIQRPRRFCHDSEEEDNKTNYSPSATSDGDVSSDDFMRDHAETIKESEAGFQRTLQDTGSSFGMTDFILPTSTGNASTTTPQEDCALLEVSNTQPSIFVNSSPAQQPVQYPRLPVQAYTPHLQLQMASGSPMIVDKLLMCKFSGCNQTFPTAQLLLQHRQTHKVKPRIDQLHRVSPSFSNSPSLAPAGDTDMPQPVFTCPRCGKTFGKVKSRNAHMKTHGKHAQEKRKQKEEEARRKMEEAEAWKERARQHVYLQSATNQKGKAVLHFQASPPHIKQPGI